MIKGLHHFFIDSLEKYENNIAIISSKKTLTYKEVDFLSNQLANQMQNSGVRESDIVGIFLEDGVWQIIAILAALKINTTYLPISQNTPVDRIKAMFEIAGCRYLVSNKLDTNLSNVTIIKINKIEQFPTKVILPSTLSLSPAYVIFTSGSTGTPKGVLMGHAGPINTVRSMADIFSLSSEDAIIQNVSIGFDPSVWIIFWPLLHGAKIIIPDANNDADNLCDLIDRYTVRVLHTGPALFSGIMQSAKVAKLKKLQLVIGGGQAWQLKQLKLLSKYLPKCNFCNVYGPTEASIHATAWPVSAQHLKKIEDVSIGYPIKNMKVYILNEELGPVLEGVVGDLYLAGIGLFDGYINQHELTNSVCFESAKLGRIYKTGDRASFSSDGSIKFIGRVDDQIQIRGHRVELAEIENLLNVISLVKDALVIIDDQELENLKIRAFIVPFLEGDSSILNEIRQYFYEKLPDYMCPSSINLIQSIPLTDNGKPDKRKLLDDFINAKITPLASNGSIFDEIKNIWESVLKKEIIYTSNFFEAGGDSLDALKLVANLNRKFPTSISVIDIFNYPTITLFSEYVEKLLITTPNHAIEQQLTTPGIDKRILLSDNQLWLLAVARDSKTINNIVIPIKITGDIDISVLQATVDRLIATHDILRANLLSMSLSELIFRKNIGSVFTYEDISSLKSVDKKYYIIKASDRLNNKEIDLVNEPLFSVHVISLNRNTCVLLIFMHHIISDPVSMEIIIDDIIHSHDASKSVEKTDFQSSAQYLQYLRYEQNQYSRSGYDDQLIAITQKLIDWQRCIDYGDTNEGNREAAFYRCEMPSALSASITHYACTRQQTVFTILFSAFVRMLYLAYKQPRFVVGVNVSRRYLAQYSRMIGPLSEQAVLFFDINEMPTYEDLIPNMQLQLKNILGEQHITLWKIYEHMNIGEKKYSPEELFNTLFDYEPLYFKKKSSHLMIEPQGIKPSKEMRRHLTMRVAETKKGFEFQVRYRKSLFNRSEIMNCIHNMILELNNIVKMSPVN